MLGMLRIRYTQALFPPLGVYVQNLGFCELEKTAKTSEHSATRSQQQIDKRLELP